MGDITGDGTAVGGLGGAAGFGETALLRGDDTVTQVDVSAVFAQGFDLGDTIFAGSQLYVSTDGMVSFGAGGAGIQPPPAPFLAIFNADVDTRLDGEGAESGAVWLDVDSVQDCVTITWDHVGFYRRNASLTDTFQMQLFDRGNGAFDVVFRYQQISWTAGDLQGGWDGLGGTAAMIGTRAASSGAALLMAASGDQAAELALDTTTGNTGVKGLWLYHFGSGGGINGTIGADRLAGTPGDDVMHGLAGDDVLLGSTGADVLDGGDGLDRADYSAATGAVLIDLRAAATNRGQAAGDSYAGIEAFTGSRMADTISGAARSDWFDGGMGLDSLLGLGGADSLSGGDQNDRLFGGAGQDLLSGGLGNDLLDGGFGSDTLAGGTGADGFVYAGTGRQGRDWISDYDAAAGDYLDIGRADVVRGDFKLTFVSDPGAGLAGVAEAHVTYVPTGGLIWVLVDGANDTAIMVHSSMNSFDLL